MVRQTIEIIRIIVAYSVLYTRPPSPSSYDFDLSTEYDGLINKFSKLIKLTFALVQVLKLL